MSYDIIRSINEKKRVITYAPNNIRPLITCKAEYGEDKDLNEFRASVIVDLLWGNYHYSNKQHIYNLVKAKVKATKEYEELEEKIWNWNNTHTKEWVKDNYDNNIAELKQLVIKTFEELKDKPKEEWVITEGYCYIKRFNKWTYSYCSSKEKALKFGCKEAAEAELRFLEKGWYVERLAD